MPVNAWTMVATLAGGLGLFLLGMTMMTDGLKLAAGPALERVLTRATRTRWHALTSGALMTAVGGASTGAQIPESHTPEAHWASSVQGPPVSTSWPNPGPSGSPGHPPRIHAHARRAAPELRGDDEMTMSFLSRDHHRPAEPTLVGRGPTLCCVNG